MTWVSTGVTVASIAYGAYQTDQANKKATYNEALQAAYARSESRAKSNQSILQGASALKEAAMSAALTRQEGIDAKQAALDEADQIKRRAMLQRGQIITAQAASGTVIGEGSAQASIDQLDTLSAADALVAIYSGVNTAASKRLQAQMIIEAGMEQAKAFASESASQSVAGNALNGTKSTRTSPWGGAALQSAAIIAGGYAKSSANTTSQG